VRGAELVLDVIERELNIRAGETTEDGNFTLEKVNCLGACALGPLVVIDGEYHGKMDQKKITKLLEQYEDRREV
jgi:NADH-quinone oxidoreductase subunit E